MESSSCSRRPCKSCKSREITRGCSIFMALSKRGPRSRDTWPARGGKNMAMVFTGIIRSWTSLGDLQQAASCLNRRTAFRPIAGSIIHLLRRRLLRRSPSSSVQLLAHDENWRQELLQEKAETLEGLASSEEPAGRSNIRELSGRAPMMFDTYLPYLRVGKCTAFTQEEVSSQP